jgi:hypothetical protein
VTAVTVGGVRELLAAVDAGVSDIRVSGSLTDVPSLRLSPGQSLTGTSDADAICFTAGADGIAVTSGNRLSRLTLRTGPRLRCIHLATDRKPASVDAELVFQDLRTTGQLQLIFDDHRRAAQVRIGRLHVEAADTRSRRQRPAGNGVSCLQGAITIWNRAREERELAVELSGISVGEAGGHGIVGSGLMVAGAGGNGGGHVRIRRASAGAIHIDSGLATDNHTTICGGILLLHGVKVEKFYSTGLQESYGPNAVPIDNWGHLDTWVVDGNVVTHGLNAVAVVNAGTIGRLEIKGRIDTHGDGARGCAIYGPMCELQLDVICTRGAGATGIQICDRLDRLSVRRGIEIYGKAGKALVKGQILHLNADGVHIQPGGRLLDSDIAFISLADPVARGIRDEGFLSPSSDLSN